MEQNKPDIAPKAFIDFKGHRLVDHFDALEIESLEKYTSELKPGKTGEQTWWDKFEGIHIRYDILWIAILTIIVLLLVTETIHC